jgi:hypothetical protein
MKRIKSQAIPYGVPTLVVVPQRTVWLGIAPTLDTNASHIKPRLGWIEDSAFPARKPQWVILFRGDADLEFDGFKNIEPIFFTHDANRRGGGIATLCKAEKVVEQVVESPPVKKKAPPTPASPESIAAVEAHERKIRLKKEQEQALKEAAEFDELIEVAAKLKAEEEAKAAAPAKLAKLEEDRKLGRFVSDKKEAGLKALINGTTPEEELSKLEEGKLLEVVESTLRTGGK